MASVFQRGGRWYVRFRDPRGLWVKQVSTAKSKTEARRLAEDLERKAERQRHGLEALPDDSGLTLDGLCDWWLTNKCPQASLYRERGRLQKHVKGTAFGRLPARVITGAAIEKHLRAIEKAGAAPASLNKLRAILFTVYSRAIRAGVFCGINPASTVERRKVPRRSYVTLREEEIPAMLEQVPAAWRDLFAVAIWTGMRKGELLGLRKSALDFDGKNILVERSYDRETTKGGHADLIPMADAIVPILLRACGQSPSDFVFPAPDGKMRKPSSAKLEVIIRRAFARAGLVEGYEHVCRRCKANGRPHSERAPDSKQRRCPRCNMLLWPRALPRRIRFHDVRHYAERRIMPTRPRDLLAVAGAIRRSRLPDAA
jgi:integrase